MFLCPYLTYENRNLLYTETKYINLFRYRQPIDNIMEPKQYINGSMLSKNIGKSVCAIGKVTMNSPNGNEIKVQLSDGKEVMVQLDEHLQEPVDGYIQMVATVKNDNSLNAQACVCFGAGEIDLDIYNQAVDVASRHPNLFSTG